MSMGFELTDLPDFSAEEVVELADEIDDICDGHSKVCVYAAIAYLIGQSAATEGRAEVHLDGLLDLIAKHTRACYRIFTRGEAERDAGPGEGGIH